MCPSEASLQIQSKNNLLEQLERLLSQHRLAEAKSKIVELVEENELLRKQLLERA